MPPELAEPPFPLPSLGKPPVPAQPRQELTLHLEELQEGAGLAARTLGAKKRFPHRAQLPISNTSSSSYQAQPDERLWVYQAPPDGS